MSVEVRLLRIYVCHDDGMLTLSYVLLVGLITSQLLIIVLNTDSAEFGLTIAAIPVVIVLLVLCATAVQREIKWLMSISLILMLAAETYFGA